MGAAAPFLIFGALQSAQAGYQAAGSKSAGRLANQEAKFNARMAEIQAEDALARGEKDASRVRRAGRGVMGAQKAAVAGQGVLVDAGSAGELLDDTRKLTEEDVMTAKNNAWREAFGYQVRASESRLQGRMAQLRAKNEARNTLISGGLNAALSFKQGYDKMKPPKAVE